MVVMDMENEDQVSERVYYVSKILRGVITPLRILWILGGGVLNPNNPLFTPLQLHWLDHLFLNT